MSKRTRKNKKLAGNSGAVAPPVQVQQRKKSRRLTVAELIEQKPMYVNKRAIELLILAYKTLDIHTVRKHDPGGSLYESMQQTKSLLEDRLLHIRELEATARANSFWFQSPTARVDRVVGKLRKGRKTKKHRKEEGNILCLSPEEMKNLIPYVCNGKANLPSQS